MKQNKPVKSDQNNLFFENRILRVEHVAEMLGFHPKSVYRLANQKLIPSYKKGKTLFFMSRDIYEWLEKGAS